MQSIFTIFYDFWAMVLAPYDLALGQVYLDWLSHVTFTLSLCCAIGIIFAFGRAIFSLFRINNRRR